MAEVKLRFNIDTEEVEFVVDDKVVVASGQDVFESWVNAYNAKHPPTIEPEAPVDEKVVDATTSEVVVQTPTESSIDNASGE